MPTPMSVEALRARLAAALPSLAFGAARAAPGTACRAFPDWASEAGALALGESLFVYVGSAADVPGATMGQAVLDVPEGRYLVETFDIRERAWIVRESASASPLVVGVPARPGGIVLRISPWGPGTRSAEASLDVPD